VSTTHAQGAAPPQPSDKGFHDQGLCSALQLNHSSPILDREIHHHCHQPSSFGSSLKCRPPTPLCTCHHRCRQRCRSPRNLAGLDWNPVHGLWTWSIRPGRRAWEPCPPPAEVNLLQYVDALSSLTLGLVLLYSARAPLPFSSFPLCPPASLLRLSPGLLESLCDLSTATPVRSCLEVTTARSLFCPVSVFASSCRFLSRLVRGRACSHASVDIVQPF